MVPFDSNILHATDVAVDVYRTMIKSGKRAGILLLLALLFAGQNASAQVQALIKVGINGSTLRGNTSTDFSPIVRLSGGAGISFELRNGFYLQPEVLYIVKGAKADGIIPGNIPGDSVRVKATFDLTYLEIPLLLVYKFNSAGIRPHIFVGPSLAVKLDAQIRFRAAEGGPEFREEDETVEDRDIGLTFGAGFEIDVGSETLSFGLRSTLGFSNARTRDDLPLHNTSVGLYAAIVF